MKTLLACLAYIMFMILFIIYLVKTAKGDPKEYPNQHLPVISKKYDNFLIFLMIMGAIGCLLIIVFLQQTGQFNKI